MEERYSGWPEWELMDKLGEGSFGKVYRARRVEGTREFYSAIKIVTIPYSGAQMDELGMEGMDEISVRRYLRGVVDECINEIEMMERLKGNSNIVAVEDFKVVEHPDAIRWDIYIRMELLESFVRYLCHRKLTEKEVIRLGIDICSALILCEKQGIIHRDIKPENIFVSPTGNFKLGDFGIARKLEKTGRAMSQKGTYSYMAPEVFYGKEYDASIDTYSLGVVLYRLLNHNRGPFLDPSREVLTYQDREEALQKRMSGERPPVPCEASETMAGIILKACSYYPEYRYQSAVQLREELQRAARGERRRISPQEEETVAISRTVPREIRKNSLPPERPGKKSKTIAVLLGVGTAAVIAAGFLFAMIFLGSDDTEDSSREEASSQEEVRKTEASPLPIPTEVPASEKNDAPKAEENSDVVQEPAVPEPSEAEAPVNYETYYVVNCRESITLRTSPSATASEICQIPLGASVSYVETAENGFYKIIYDGKTGYGLASYLSAVPSSSGNSRQQSYPTYYVVDCRESITLRAEPSTSASEICQIPLGASVSYVGGAQNGFSEIIYHGNTGYALSSYLSSDAAVGNGMERIYEVVNCQESITLRTSPSTSASEICQIPLGETVIFYGEAENGFCQVEYGGKSGYALANYLRKI